jgi:hypothetical protein
LADTLACAAAQPLVTLYDAWGKPDPRRHFGRRRQRRAEPRVTETTRGALSSVPRFTSHRAGQLLRQRGSLGFVLQRGGGPLCAAMLTLTATVLQNMVTARRSSSFLDMADPFQ